MIDTLMLSFYDEYKYITDTEWYWKIISAMK